MDLQEIKEATLKSHNTLSTSETLLDDNEMLWLIEQAEILEAIKKEIKGRWGTETVSVHRLHQIIDK